MAFMWLLLRIVFVAVVCTAREMIKSWKTAFPQSAVVVNSRRSRPIPVAPSSPLGKYSAKRLSLKECKRLLDESEAIVFIAISGDSRKPSCPFPELTSLSISPNELGEVLHWLPTGRSVVLCGQVDLCSSTIRVSDLSAGEPHIYVLQSQTAHSMAG